MKRMQKIVSPILSILLCLSLLPLSALADDALTAAGDDNAYLAPAEEAPEGTSAGEAMAPTEEGPAAGAGEEALPADGTAIEDMPCGENLTCTLDDNGVLTIRGTGTMYPFSADGSVLLPWVNYGRRQDIRTLVLEDGVTNISSYAFENCDSLTSVSIPDSVRIIGVRAFANSDGLQTITIPAGVEEIHDGAFKLCKALKTITLPPAAQLIGDSIFQGCIRLTSITLPENIERIEKDTFNGCAALETVSIPTGVKYIDGSAFRACVKLTSITIPDGVLEIASEAFAFCSSLKTVYLPSTLQNIGDSAFDSAVKDIYYSGGEEEWNSIHFGRSAVPSNTTIHFAVDTLPAPEIESLTNTADGVKVAWGAVNGASQYRVLRKTEDGSWEKVGDTSDCSYTDGTAVNGTKYTYTVRCLSADGERYTSGYDETGVSILYTAGSSGEDDLPFTDVTSQWFASSVRFVYDHALFKGTSDTTFSPNANMTRGMFITVLGRFACGSALSAPREKWSGVLGVTEAEEIAVCSVTTAESEESVLARIASAGESVTVLSRMENGLDGAVWYKVDYNGTVGYIRWKSADDSMIRLKVYTGGFQDLPDGAYYTGHAQWAYIQGVMNGVSATEFRPAQNIRREDICVLLYRYLTECCGKSFDPSEEAFSDDSAIDAYARDAVYAMRSAGVVSGYPDNSFRPGAYATRAEVAKMFENLYDYLNQT